ncbi:MAG TPA: glycosyltransferase family 87 protein [Polyangia bacterium]
MPVSSFRLVATDKKRTFFHRHLTKLTTTLAVIVWGVFITGLGLGGGRLNAFTNTPFGEDLLSLHAAGQIITTQPEDLYDDIVARRVQAKTLGPVGREVYNRYLSPPHTAALLSPLSRLPFPGTLALWSAFSLVALVAAMFLLGGRRPWATLAAALVFAPVVDGFASGQNALFTLCLFALGFHFWTRGRGWWAGIAMAMVAIHKPHLLTGPALLFLLEAREDRRPLWGLLLGCAAIVSIDLFVYPTESGAFLSWGSSVLAGEAPIWSQLRPGGEFTVGAFFQLLLPTVPSVARGLAWTTQLLAIAAFVIWHRRLRGVSAARVPFNDRTLFAGVAVLTLWLTPHAHLYEWTLLVLPACLLWKEEAQRGKLAAIFLVFVALTPVCVRVARWQLSELGFALHPSLPLLLLAGAAIVFTARVRRTTRSRTFAHDSAG